MGTITDSIAAAFRDFVSDGIPSSGIHEPLKSDVRALGPLIEVAIGNAGLGALVGVTKTTKALLDADLAHDADVVALVYADATDANNDLYVKTGASGAGSWTNTGALHDAFAPFIENARVWAEGPGEPGGAGTKSAKGWAGEAAASALVVGSIAQKNDPIYVMGRQVIDCIVDGGDQVVSATYLDGTDFSSADGPALSETDAWYAGYSQITYAVLDADNAVLSGSVWDGQQVSDWVRAGAVSQEPQTIVFIGDSLTQRGMFNYVAAETGRPVRNYARGSQSTLQQAARMGAITVPMTVSGNQIVNGANSITHTNKVALAGGNGTAGSNQFLSRADSNTTDSVRGRLGSVRGTLVRTASGGPPSTTEVYTFTPDAGETLPAKYPPGTVWQTDYADRGLTHVIWLGTNDIGYGDAAARYAANITAIVEALGHRRFVLLNPLNRTGQVAFQEGGQFWTETFALEAYAAGLGRENFVNIRRLLIDQGLQRAGITPTATDLTDIAADTMPTSLKADPIHNTTACDQEIAKIIAAELSARNY